MAYSKKIVSFITRHTQTLGEHYVQITGWNLMGDEFMESYGEVEHDELSISFIWTIFEHGMYIVRIRDRKLIVCSKNEP